MRAFVRKQQKACAARNGFRHKFCNGLFIPPDRYSDHPADKQYIGKMKKKEGKCISRCSAGLLCALQAKWIVCEHKK